LVALFSSLFISSFWYSYILILVFLGGMLILFIYVASIASNEVLNLRRKTLYLSTPLVFLGLLLPFNTLRKLPIANDNWFSDRPFLWQFRESLTMFTSFLVVYLFFVLVAIVKITKFWRGALRKITT
jgi:NADH-ubiquinone oxidoreductase chain 6